MLFSDGLLSKWGFNGGDAPDDFIDWLEAGGYSPRIDWHPVLVKIVKDFLVPALDQDVDVYTCETCHNPVRAETVNWREVDADAELSPEFIEVPFAVVLGAALELGALGGQDNTILSRNQRGEYDTPKLGAPLGL
jgi:hypothetical protein